MSHIHYGVYLIPPPQLIYQIGLAHQLLLSEFNAKIAGKFMVHCTLKGFFKPKEGTTYHDFITNLDALFQNQKPITLEFPQLAKVNMNNHASILLLMATNQPLMQLHNAIWDVVADYIAPDCAFSAREPARINFMPHITLAQHDLPTEEGLFAQAADFCQYMLDTHLQGQFIGRDLQLIEFYADDWAGNWGDTMRYKQIKGWQLSG
jgi:2'-5' RNA ligase